MSRRFALTVAVLCLAGCAGTADFSSRKILHARYDGAADDLLTGGLGKTGLGLAQPPAVRDPKNPTAAELRRRAIHANYRALADMTPGGGYGVLYGPNIDLAGKDTLGEGKVAGDEYLTVFDGATLMVQVPDRFDPKNPCIVTATSSGSRGIYGAVGTSGEWGLKRGCAVAYTDKGTGTGFHDLATDSVNLVTGEWVIREKAGGDALFAAPLTDAERARYLREFPNRIAVKQAHSQRNPEKDWGRYTLAAIDFSFFIINSLKDSRAGTYTPENTLVIASSVSNGGYSALMAAEQDTRGLIDGVAVSEPNVSLADVRSLLDYTTLLNVYLPCAAANVNAPLNTVAQPLREARCASLAKKGLLKSTDLAGQAEESWRILLAYGFLPEAGQTLPAHYTLYVPQSISLQYANSYGRFSVTDNLCGYSYAATAASGDNAAQPIPATGLELSFAASNGIPPTGGVNMVNNLSTGGAREDRLSISPSTGARDMNLDGALCLRSLVSGTDDNAKRVQAGIAETRLTGRLNGKPAIMVQGRADAILPPNFTSRAYFARNKALEPNSKLYYYEVTNAHHLDVLNGVPGFDSRYVPLHVYFVQSLNMMYDHLKSGRPLPTSQLVRTKPREQQKDGKTVPIERSNVPPIESSLGANSLISVGLDGRLRIPE